MLIGFDAKRFFSNFTGLGNYSRFVVDALSKGYPEESYSLFAPRIKSHPEYDHILSRPNVQAIGPSGIEKAVRSLWRSVLVSQEPAVQKLDIFHGLSQEIPLYLPSKVKTVVTVHDLIFFRYPQYYNPIDVAIYKAKVLSACRRADLIIAISEQTADDVAHFLKVSRTKIRVVYQGCHPSFRTMPSAGQRAAIKSAYKLPDRYILNVGTVETRKNLALLVKALPLLSPDCRLKLVVVGRSTKYKDFVLRIARDLGVVDELVFLENVSFAHLPTIYQMAEVFVYPSEFEGFGIPIVEAIESGIPVIAATGSCLEEAGGPDSCYVDPQDHGQLASCLNQVLSDEDLRQRMTGRSAQYVKKFLPTSIASDLFREYSALL